MAFDIIIKIFYFFIFFLKWDCVKYLWFVSVLPTEDSLQSTPQFWWRSQAKSHSDGDGRIVFFSDI